VPADPQRAQSNRSRCKATPRCAACFHRGWHRTRRLLEAGVLRLGGRTTGRSGCDSLLPPRSPTRACLSCCAHGKRDPSAEPSTTPTHLSVHVSAGPSACSMSAHICPSSCPCARWAICLLHSCVYLSSHGRAAPLSCVYLSTHGCAAPPRRCRASGEDRVIHSA
jgi:hypothetical protein